MILYSFCIFRACGTWRRRAAGMETGERTTQGATGVQEGRHWEKQANCLSEEEQDFFAKGHK